MPRRSILHFPFYPFLYSVFIIVGLYAHNMGSVSLSDIYRTMVFSIALCTVFVAVSAIFIHHRHKRAFVAAAALMICFSHGAIGFAVARFPFLPFRKVSELAMVGLSLLFFVVLCVMALRSASDFSRITRMANVASLAFGGAIGLTILYNSYNLSKLPDVAIPSRDSIRYSAAGTRSGDQLPDIYYIILDEYAGSDTLARLYDCDNEKFIDALKDRGFYVAPKSWSNYSLTSHSIASSLNLRYLQEFYGIASSKSTSLAPLINLINENQTCAFLKDAGYRIVTFSSESHLMHRIGGAEVFLHYRWELSEFEIVFLRSTIFGTLTDRILLQSHREKILSQFDQLSRIHSVVKSGNHPLFVFAHILAPHAPFVFDHNGEPLPGEPVCFQDRTYIGTYGTLAQYRLKYRDQLQFINRMVLAAIDATLRQSVRPPIIIVQGDHGPRSTQTDSSCDGRDAGESFSILNAYYLPNVGRAVLYDSISPVNTFRVILRYYFGASLPLLGDQSYCVSEDQPYEFREVKPAMRSGAVQREPR